MNGISPEGNVGLAEDRMSFRGLGFPPDLSITYPAKIWPLKADPALKCRGKLDPLNVHLNIEEAQMSGFE